MFTLVSRKGIHTATPPRDVLYRRPEVEELEGRNLPSCIVLTDREWVVSARDVAGTNWSNSILNFTSQTPEASGRCHVEGSFDWVGNGVPRGRELFRGTLSDDRELMLRGFALVNPINIGLASYKAEVTADGNAIINGVWSDPLVIPGTWSAVPRSLPDIQMLGAQLAPTGVRFEYAVTGSTLPFTIGLYRSADVQFDASDSLLATQTATPEPNSSGAGVFARAITPDSVRPYVLVVADPPSAVNPQGRVRESNENNNVGAVSVSNIQFLSFAKNVGRSREALGEQGSNGDMEVRYRVSGAQLPNDANVTLAVYWARGPREADKIEERAAVVTAPLMRTAGEHVFAVKISRLIDPPSGATHLIVVLDNGRALAETRESDNVGAIGNLNGRLSFELQSSAPSAVTREERVRLWLRSYADLIRRTGAEFNIDPVAIAGAIAWEALQNVNWFSARGAGPGKVHVFEFFGRADAELVEGTYRYGHFLPRLSLLDRIATVRQPEGAIRYIAAIMNAYATEAETAPSGRNIRQRPGILASYYVGEGQIVPGDRSAGVIRLENAAEGFRRRFMNPQELRPGTSMGQWVAHNEDYLKAALGLA